MAEHEIPWKRIIDKVKELLGHRNRYAVCLIGSYARGDASSISDIDLIVFTEETIDLRQTEIFHVNQKEVTIFPVNVMNLLRAKAVDFYNANNPFEAKLVFGSKEVLEKLRRGLRGKKIDLNATKKLIGKAVAMRLMSSMSDVILDYGEGIRDMRACLSKTKLYVKLFREGAEPWSIIPYRYAPEDKVEKLIERLYRSSGYEDLLAKIRSLELKDLTRETFKEHVEIIRDIIRKIEDYISFAGKHARKYVNLYLIIEEKIRSTIWTSLPSRWEIEEEFNSKVSHYHTHIACTDENVWWIVSVDRDGNLELEHYGETEF